MDDHPFQGGGDDPQARAYHTFIQQVYDYASQGQSSPTEFALPVVGRRVVDHPVVDRPARPGDHLLVSDSNRRRTTILKRVFGCMINDQILIRPLFIDAQSFRFHPDFSHPEKLSKETRWRYDFMYETEESPASYKVLTALDGYVDRMETLQLDRALLTAQPEAPANSGGLTHPETPSKTGTKRPRASSDAPTSSGSDPSSPIPIGTPRSNQRARESQEQARELASTTLLPYGWTSCRGKSNCMCTHQLATYLKNYPDDRFIGLHRSLEPGENGLQYIVCLECPGRRFDSGQLNALAQHVEAAEHTCNVLQRLQQSGQQPKETSFTLHRLEALERLADQKGLANVQEYIVTRSVLQKQSGTPSSNTITKPSSGRSKRPRLDPVAKEKGSVTITASESFKAQPDSLSRRTSSGVSEVSSPSAPSKPLAKKYVKSGRELLTASQSKPTSKAQPLAPTLEQIRSTMMAVIDDRLKPKNKPSVSIKPTPAPVRTTFQSRREKERAESQKVTNPTSIKRPSNLNTGSAEASVNPTLTRVQKLESQLRKQEETSQSFMQKMDERFEAMTKQHADEMANMKKVNEKQQTQISNLKTQLSLQVARKEGKETTSGGLRKENGSAKKTANGTTSVERAKENGPTKKETASTGRAKENGSAKKATTSVWRGKVNVAAKKDFKQGTSRL